MSFGDLKVQDLIYEDSSNNEITVVIADLATKANPVFSGTVTVPTATANDNTTKAASTAYVQTELGDYLTTATATSTYAPKNAPAFTGSATGVNLTLSGDLTVNGTTTTINTTTLQVEDKNIEIGKVASPSDTTADGGGWSLLGSTTKTFNWVNATDAWTSSEHIHILDDKKLLVGTGSDLEIFHNGTNSIISNQTGDLSIRSPNNIVFMDYDAEETFAKFVDNGAVELYHNNVKKIETSATGCTVTGTLAATAVTGDGSGLTNLPPAGNTVDLVADGAIAAGKPVIITTAGKAKQVGMEFTVRSGNPDYAATMLDHQVSDDQCHTVKTINCGTNLIFNIWYNQTDSKWTYNVTYTSGTGTNPAKASTYGNTDSALGGVSSNTSIALAYLGNNKVCIFYNGVTAGQVHALIAEINPSTRAVTFGSAVQLGGGNCRNCAVSYDTDNSRLLFCWNNASTNGRGYYRSASFSGTTITTLGSGASEFPRIGSNYGIEQIRNVYDTSADRHVIAFNYQDNSNDGYAFSVQTTGSTFTAGSLFAFTTGAVNNSMGFDAVFDSVNNRTIVVWAESTTSNILNYNIRGLICNASTGAITAAGNKTTGSSWYPWYSEASMVFEPNLDRAYVMAQYRSGSSGSSNVWIIIYVLTYNSSTGEYSSTGGWAIYAATNLRRYLGIARFGNSENELQIISNRTWESTDTNRYFDVTRLLTMQSQTNFTSSQRNFLGFAEDAISDGATGTIKLDGNVVGNQSGLTAGTLYKTNNDGTLTGSWGSNEVGLLAVAADKGVVMRSLA